MNRNIFLPLFFFLPIVALLPLSGQAQTELVLPYDAASLTEEQKNSNPDFAAFPLALKDEFGTDKIAKCAEPTDGLGPFSVSATTQVYFSPGNLQYQASTNTWRFAEHQWDYIGDANKNISSTYSGWIDLFGWGTGNAPTKSTTNNNYYSSFTNWGNNSISNGGNEANLWRTLTKDEWVYLFTTRSNASGKYGAAKVNGMTGVVLLPDEWTLPSGCGFTAGMTSASQWYDWSKVASTNVYTSTQWEQMEANGAVFLPASGDRLETSVNFVGSRGFYYSSTPDGSSDAYGVDFNIVILAPEYSYDGRDVGYSIRLVSGL